jgi:hypothetical protein
VKELVIESGTEGSYAHPRIDLRASDDRRHEFRSALGSAPSRYKVGDEVSILYDPDDLDPAEIASSFALYLLPISCLIFGTLTFAAGALCLAFAVS